MKLQPAREGLDRICERITLPRPHLYRGPSDQYGPFLQRYPIGFGGSLVRQIKIWSDGLQKLPSSRYDPLADIGYQ